MSRREPRSRQRQKGEYRYHPGDALGQLRANRQRMRRGPYGKALDALAAQFADCYQADGPGVPPKQAGAVMLWIASVLSEIALTESLDGAHSANLVAFLADDLIAAARTETEESAGAN